MSLPGRGLGTRFDTRVLRPPAVAANESARLQDQPASAAALLAWCQGGGPDLAVAVLQGSGPAPNLAAWADALARHLDGGTRLDALGRSAGLAWRLRIKLREAWPGRARQPDDPWDAGWALASGAALAHWHSAWQPRRPTLVLAEAGRADVLAPALAALAQRLAGSALALRWLWVGGDEDWPPRQQHPVARFRLA